MKWALGVHVRNLSLVTTVVLGAACGTRQQDGEASSTVAMLGTITGTATYRERIALPPDATLEAVLVDVTGTDAASQEISRTTIQRPSHPPIAFTIGYEPRLIDEQRRYAIRARILVDGLPWFATDQMYPVLTHGAGREAELLLRRVTSVDAPPALMGGEMVYMADAARFYECATGRSYPIAMEGAYIDLERAYGESARPPGSRLYVTFEGTVTDRPKMDGVGNEPTVVVGSFVGVWPHQDCARAQSDAPLVGTVWRIVTLDGAAVSPVTGRREPSLTLTSTAGQVTYSATVGCNGVGGDVTLNGDRITFGAGIGTLMSCGDALDAVERRMVSVLSRATQWRIVGPTLVLRDAGGATLARLEVVTQR